MTNNKSLYKKILQRFKENKKDLSSFLCYFGWFLAIAFIWWLYEEDPFIFRMVIAWIVWLALLIWLIYLLFKKPATAIAILLLIIVIILLVK